VALQRYFELLAMFLTIDTTDDQRIGLAEFTRAAPAFRDWGLSEAGKRGGYIVRNAKAEFAKIDTNRQGYVLLDEFAKWALEVNLRLLPDAPETSEDLRRMRSTAGSVEAARTAAKKANARIKKVRNAQRAEAAAQAKEREVYWARMQALVKEHEKQPHVSLAERNTQLLHRRRHVKTKTDSDVMDEFAGKYMERLHELGEQERRTLNERLAEENRKHRERLRQARSRIQETGMNSNAAYEEKVMERMNVSGASATSLSAADIALDASKDAATLIREIRSRFTSVRDGQSLDGWTRRHNPFRERLRAREGLDVLERKFAKMAPPKPPPPPTAADAAWDAAYDAASTAAAFKAASTSAATADANAPASGFSSLAPSGKTTFIQSEPTLSRTEDTGVRRERSIYNTVHRSTTARQGTARQGTSRKASSRASPPVRHTNRTMLFDEKLGPVRGTRSTARGKCGPTRLASSRRV